MNHRFKSHPLKILIAYYLIIMCIMFALSLRAEAEMYKWVDENGVVHFSDTPPSDKQVESVQERPVEKVGGTESTPATLKPIKPISESTLQRQIDSKEERIRYYEKEISDCEKEIAKYKQRIEELEIKKWNLPSHYSSHSEGEHYSNLKKSYDSSIKRYEEGIEDKKNQINEFKYKIADLKNQLHELRLQAISTP